MSVYLALAARAVPVERLVANLSEYGNTSAASIPLALDEAVRRGDIKAGQVVSQACSRACMSMRAWRGSHERAPTRRHPPSARWLPLRGASPSSQVAMAGFGAGLSSAAAIVRWG